MRRYLEITVEGKGHFPLDMLRYSCCWPVHPQDVANIEPRDELDYYKEQRSVTVGFTGTMGNALNCCERFASFGWVGSVTKEEPIT
jgi:hypothetical protein